jgi:2-haloacid dehalogenase
MKPRAVVFDAYGTLFDVHSVITHANNNMVGDLRALSTSWRQRQLEYPWLRSLMERYEDFWNITETALRSALRELHIHADEAQLNRLMGAYLFPSAFEDVNPALESLGELPMAILSNGSMNMLESAVDHNEIGWVRCEGVRLSSLLVQPVERGNSVSGRHRGSHCE